jgi:glycosyltransferase involved in cell wall biosynthesis
MKILVTSIVDLKKSQPNRLHQFIRYLCTRHEITVISINDWWKGKQLPSSCGDNFQDIFDKIKYFYLTEKEINPALQELFFKGKIEEALKEHFDVHLNYGTLMSGFRVAEKVSTVFDISDDNRAMIRESPQIPKWLKPLSGVLADLMIRNSIERAKKVTVITEALARVLKIPSNKCVLIPNGVDTDQFRNYGCTKKELGLKGFIIGYVGVLREWVDLGTVFSALKGLREEINMLVVGREGLFNENIRLARRYGVSGRVTFVGAVPYSQVPRYISAMDIALIPFRRNPITESALPLKLFEYMACERPVISTKLRGVTEVAGDRIVYASGVEELRTRILELYKNEDLRRRLALEGRKFVNTNYSWPKICEKMERVLQEVASIGL